MSVQTVDEVKSPSVGKYYIVPTLFSVAWSERVPLFGPPHEDKDHLDFPDVHYHLDWRFVASGFYERKIRERYNGDPRFLYGIVLSVKNASAEGIILKRLLMRREWPDYPPSPRVPWLPRLQKAYLKERLSSCLKCPHRGISLRHSKPDESGLVVCRGHGLRWNVNTLRLAPFSFEPQEA